MIEAVSKQKDQERKLLAKGKEALENAKRNCIEKGFSKETYAAVALGRSSSESSLLTRLFRGPVCSILFKELTDTALWLCP